MARRHVLRDRRVLVHDARAHVARNPLSLVEDLDGAIREARLTYCETAVLPTPVASRTSRTLSPSSCVSRSTSRIFLIDILILAIGSPCCSSQGLPIC